MLMDNISGICTHCLWKNASRNCSVRFVLIYFNFELCDEHIMALEKKLVMPVHVCEFMNAHAWNSWSFPIGQWFRDFCICHSSFYGSLPGYKFTE
jgi:hypothetical protein